MRLVHRVVAATILASISLGTASTAASAAPSTARATNSISAPAAAPVRTAAVSAPAAATSLPAAPASTERYGRGTIVINLLKRAATWIFNTAVSKARAGWTAFKNWWAGISYWIRKPIEWAAGGGAYDVFTAILEWLRGVSRVDTSVG